MERTVQVLGEPQHVTTSRETETKWPAVGIFRGTRVEATQSTEGAALKAWREAARLGLQPAAIHTGETK